MKTVEIYFNEPASSDLLALGSFEFPDYPRKGDTVVLGEQGEFEVEYVIWDIDGTVTLHV